MVSGQPEEMAHLKQIYWQDNTVSKKKIISKNRMNSLLMWNIFLYRKMDL